MPAEKYDASFRLTIIVGVSAMLGAISSHFVGKALSEYNLWVAALGIFGYTIGIVLILYFFFKVTKL